MRNERTPAALSALLKGRAAQEVKIFAGMPNERCFKLPASFTAERIAEWVQTVEGVRGLKKRITPTPHSSD
jgi:hypothetical protein